jgi:hypothetical protein
LIEQADLKWIKFATTAAQMIRSVRLHRHEPFEPIIEFIENTEAISNDELRSDLINVLYELGGSPASFDSAIGLLELSQSEQHFLDLQERIG